MGSHKLQCEGVEPLFIGFMDGMLTVLEQAELTEHLEVCEDCREEFEVYKAIRTTIDADAPEFSAPRNFESGVISKVAELPGKDCIFESIGYVLIGMIAALFGALGTIFYQDIANAVRQFVVMPQEFSILNQMFYGIEAVAANVAVSAGIAFFALLDVISQAQFVLLAIFVVLMLLQFAVYRFKNV